jgi:hypothetical protein
LTLPADRLRVYRDGSGQSWELALEEHAAAFLPRWQWPHVQLFREIGSGAGGTSGGTTGVARFTLGRQVLAEMPLLATTVD